MESGGETEVERREVEEEESARNQTQAAWWHRVGFLRFVVGEPFDEGILLGLDLLQRLVLLVESLQLRKLLVYLRLQRLLFSTSDSTAFRCPIAFSFSNSIFFACASKTSTRTCTSLLKSSISERGGWVAGGQRVCTVTLKIFRWRRTGGAGQQLVRRTLHKRCALLRQLLRVFEFVGVEHSDV